jgi:carbohydrate diacid regulator
MILSSELAQRIVARVAAGLDQGVSVVDRAARVVASTDQQLIGTQFPAAAHAMTAAMPVAGDTSDGISVPLIYLDDVVGALVLHRLAHNRSDIAYVSKAFAELIIHQASVIEQLLRQQWARSRFLSDLVHQRLAGTPEQIVQEAALFAIDLRLPRLVALICIKPLVEQCRLPAVPAASLPLISGTLRLEQLHEHLLEQLRRSVAAHLEDVSAFIDEHRLILLAVVDPLEPERRRQQLARDLHRLLDELAQATGKPISAGLGGYHAGWPALAQSWEEAQFALETGSLLYGAGGVFGVEQLGLASFICSDDPAIKADRARQLLEPLATRPDLLDTLGAFLEANLATAPTAERLHIHRHTLDYRLSKIAQLIGLDPREFQAAAQLQAALLLRKVQPAQAAAP